MTLPGEGERLPSGYPRVNSPTLVDALAAVKAEIGAIGKDKAMTEGPAKYKYRSIDDILEAAHAAIIQHGVICAPRVIGKTYEMRQTRNGNPMQWVSLDVAWTVLGPDGSRLDPSPLTVGEATDTSDKATNKAHTAAYKVVLSQLFAIPFSGEDQDADGHELGDPDPWATAPKEQRESADRLQERLDHMPAPNAADVCAAVSKVAQIEVRNVTDLPPGWLKVWRKEINNVDREPAQQPGSDAAEGPSGDAGQGSASPSISVAISQGDAAPGTAAGEPMSEGAAVAVAAVPSTKPSSVTKDQMRNLRLQFTHRKVKTEDRLAYVNRFLEERGEPAVTALSVLTEAQTADLLDVLADVPKPRNYVDGDE